MRSRRRQKEKEKVLEQDGYSLGEKELGEDKKGDQTQGDRGRGGCVAGYKGEAGLGGLSSRGRESLSAKDQGTHYSHQH